MLRSFRLVNLFLGLVAALIAFALAKTWVVPDAPISSPAIAKPTPEVEALAYTQMTRPPLAQYDLLVEKSPFKQPPPVPARSSSAPPPPPLPTVVGTILVDHERRAVLNDKGKANIYTIGQEVAGGVIIEIKEDRIVFKRGDTTHEIMLKAAIESVAAAPTQTAAPVADKVGILTQSPGPRESPVPRESPDREEMRGRREERKRERQERLQQRKAARRGEGGEP